MGNTHQWAASEPLCAKFRALAPPAPAKQLQPAALLFRRSPLGCARSAARFAPKRARSRSAACSSPGARRAPHASRPSAREADPPPAPVRAERRTPRARARAKELSRLLFSRCARSAARFAPKRAPSSSAACPEPKRARSLGGPDHDQRMRWRPTRADRTGACDLKAQRERPSAVGRR